MGAVDDRGGGSAVALHARDDLIDTDTWRVRLQNYFPVARENWYPNNASSSLGEYTAYEMIFRIPKGMKMAASER